MGGALGAQEFRWEVAIQVVVMRVQRRRGSAEDYVRAHARIFNLSSLVRSARKDEGSRSAVQGSHLA